MMRLWLTSAIFSICFFILFRWIDWFLGDKDGKFAIFLVFGWSMWTMGSFFGHYVVKP